MEGPEVQKGEACVQNQPLTIPCSLLVLLGRAVTPIPVKPHNMGLRAASFWHFLKYCLKKSPASSESSKELRHYQTKYNSKMVKKKMFIYSLKSESTTPSQRPSMFSHPLSLLFFLNMEDEQTRTSTSEAVPYLLKYSRHVLC